LRPLTSYNELEFSFADSKPLTGTRCFRPVHPNVILKLLGGCATRLRAAPNSFLRGHEALQLRW
jgi:hypothetical protein